MKTTCLTLVLCFALLLREIRTYDKQIAGKNDAIIKRYVRAQLKRAAHTLEKSFEKKNRVKKNTQQPDVVFDDQTYRNNSRFFSTSLLLGKTQNSNVYAVDEKHILKLNNDGDLQPIITFEHKRNPVMLEVADWVENITLFLIKFRHENIYVYQSTIEYNPIQTITLPISSAKCFYHDKNIYCIFIMEQYNGQSARLFKWVGTHFDLQEIIDTPVVSFAITFKWKSDILILLVPKYGQSKASLLLEWNGQSLKKIQNIKFQTSSNDCLKHFEFQSKNYIISDRVVLIWNGYRMVQAGILEHFSKFGSAISIDIWSDENSAIVFAFYKHYIVVHKQSKKFRIDQTRDVQNKLISALVVKSKSDGDAITYADLVDNKLQLTTIPFSVEKRSADILGSDVDLLKQCLSSLQNKLLMNRESIKKLEKNIPTVLRTDTAQNYSGTFKIGAAIKVKSGTVSSNGLKNYLTGPTELLMTVVELQKKANTLNHHRNNFLYKSRPNTILSNLYVPSGVSTVEGNLGSALISVAAGPDGIIFLDNPTAPDSTESVLVAQSVKVHHLYTTPGTIIDDFLFNVGDQKITGKYSGTKLFLNNIMPSSGKVNNVPIQSLLQLDDNYVYGTKTVQTLFVNNLDTFFFNQMDTLNWINDMNSASEQNFAVYENISVGNLNVDYLNGIKWNDFLSSLYLDIKGHSRIKGDILFKSRTRVHSTNLIELFSIPFENILTRTTDQTIMSNITIGNLHVDKIEAKSINGLNFKDSIARPGDLIRNVEIEHLNVEKDLTLNDNSLFDKQVTKTKIDELLQMYNAKVVIKGSVTISNLLLENNAKTYLEDSEVFLNIPQYYWTKTGDQKIKSEVKFIKNTKVPQVYLEKVNSQNWTQYITTNGELSNYGSFVFEKATIQGNLFFDENDQMYNPSFQQLDADAVRLTGKYTIESDVKFTGEIHIKNLNVQMLQEIPNTDLIWKFENNIQLSGVKSISLLNISSLLTKTACVESLNGVDLENYFNSLLTVDKPAIFESLNIDLLAAEHLSLENLNIMEATGTNDETYRSNEDGAGNKTVTINGAVHIDEIIGLQMINDVNLAKYLPLIVKLNSNTQVGGHKIFQAQINIINELQAAIISKIDLHNLYIYGLSKSKEQNITGHFQMKNIKTDYLNVRYLNEFDMTQLIDISRSTKINSPIGFKALLNIENFIWSNACNANKADLYEVSGKQWKSLYIKNKLIHKGLNKVLENLIENAVTNGFDKSITGKVQFTGHTFFHNIVTVNQYINNINLNDILEDALLKSSNVVKQITGYKIFVNQVELSESNIYYDFDAPLINGIKIRQVNESLVYINEEASITGQKIFEQGVYIKNLRVKGVVNGVPIDDVFFLDNNHVLPNVSFNSLDVEVNLEVSNINGHNFNDFLRKRLRLRGKPQDISPFIQFRHLEVTGPLYISKINKILLDDIVFTDLPDAEPIYGMKIFEKGLKTDCDISANYLNNYNLRDTYTNSIKINQDYYISHVIFKNSVQLLNGLIVNSFDNQSWLNFYVQPFSGISYADDIDQKINYSFNSIKPYYHYLYLEPSEIRIQKPPSKKVKTIRSGFLHLWNETSGEACNLPSFCPCSLQYIVDISNSKAIKILPENASHRLFSHYDNGIGVNIFTNTVSTSGFCSNTNDEFTYITWMKSSRDTLDGSPIGDITIDENRYGGYLSDTKFFRVDSKRAFLVLALYYDKNSDLHDVDSLLLEMNMVQRKTNVIQYIPTRFATALELIQSKFGIHLVICNAIETKDAQAYFEIMKFDNNTSQFKLVRTVSTEGCGLLESAVFGKEQFIFVGDENFKILRINRYIEQSDLFQYFQSFIYDSNLRGVHIFYQSSLMNEVFLCVATENGNFYIYVYTYIEGWKEISAGYLRNVNDITHFKINHKEYLFMSSSTENMIFRIIHQGIP